MQLPRTTIQAPTGLSFAIPDLLLIRAWADFHNLHMEIELDIAAGGDEYEELLNLSSRNSERRRWMIWRSREGIVVQPMMGRKMLFDVMADALEVLIPVAD
nr:hypothetical protein [uncultured Rhodopila sp.]